MNNRIAFYWSVGFLSLLFLVGFVFWGPTGPEDKNKALLWEEDWQIIEYHHKTQAEPAMNNLKPEPLLRFIRKDSLGGDRFWVATPRKELSTEFVRRSGNHNVSNLFQDWLRPQHKGIYTVDEAKIKTGGLQEPVAEIWLFEKEGATPLKLLVGTRQKNGSYFVLLKEEGEEDVLAIMGSHYIERLQYSHLQYREKRLLYYPANSYTEEIELELELNGKLQQVALYQERKQLDDKPDIKWFLRKAEGEDLEIPQHLANPLESFVKQLQIKHFQDESELAAFDADALWQTSGKDFLKVRVVIKHGATVQVTLRKPVQEMEYENTKLLLIKSRKESNIDFADAHITRDLKLHLRNILQYKPAPVANTPAGANLQAPLQKKPPDIVTDIDPLDGSKN